MYRIGLAAACAAGAMWLGAPLPNAHARSPSTPEELGLTLRLVQVVTRHGLRTPLMPPENVKGEWRCGDHTTVNTLLFRNDKDDEQFTHPAHPDYPAEQIGDHLHSSRLYRQQFIFDEAHPLPGDCYRGQLTMQGMIQLLEVGHWMRQRYVVDQAFLPPTLDPSVMYVRSSDTQRTIQSAQCLLEGMYHHVTGRPATSPVSNFLVIHTMDKTTENMYARSDCAKLSRMKREVRKTREYLAFDAQLNELREEVIKKVGYSKWPGWASVHNTLSCIEGNGLSIEGGVSEEMKKQVEKAAAFEAVVRYGDRVYSHFAIGRFWGQMMQQMDASLSGSSPHRFFLYSGHDNTLSPMLGGLGILDGHPPMASYLVVEVWEAKEGDRFVQVLYNGEPQVLEGQQQPLVEWAAFRKLIGQLSLTQKEYAEQCREA